VPLRSVTLVAVTDVSRSERVLAVSSVSGRRARFNVPRNLRLRQGETTSSGDDDSSSPGSLEAEGRGQRSEVRS
jgi:hypothetical protein